MTVKELIEKLQKCDPGKKVGICEWVSDSEYTGIKETENGVYFI